MLTGTERRTHWLSRLSIFVSVGFLFFLNVANRFRLMECARQVCFTCEEGNHKQALHSNLAAEHQAKNRPFVCMFLFLFLSQ